jgi:hypothetical protein
MDFKTWIENIKIILSSHYQDYEIIVSSHYNDYESWFKEQ